MLGSEVVTRVVCCSVTAAGGELARRLPYEHRAGNLIDTVTEEWERADAFVLVAATGIAVRAIAPLLKDKRTDPPVVCVDDGGRFAIALTGGHGGGNDLALDVSSLVGAIPVITTATDARGLPALDDLPGFAAEGDVAGLTRRWLDGAIPSVRVDPALAGWPVPPALAAAMSAAVVGVRGAAGGAGAIVTVSDTGRPPGPGEVLLRPSSIVLGVGASSGADPVRLWELAHEALAGCGLSPRAVGAVATLDRKAAEPAIASLAERLSVPLVTFTPDDLKAGATDRQVPNPSKVVEAAVGTPSVAEAAALLAGGPDSTLLAPKRASNDSTVAVARRARPAGRLAVVGMGPGDPAMRTPQAVAAVRHAQVVMGYERYVDQAADLLSPGQLVLRSPIGAERARCADALERAASGHTVALVCSGDPGVYAMASLVCELAPAAGDPPVTIVAGVTAALSGAALLGAPLGHDHASISLSDLLTPWPAIVRRIRAAAEGDFVVSLYNPRSHRRGRQLVDALTILAKHRSPETPAAVLTDIGRPGQHIIRATLATLDPEDAGMLSLVIVGSTQTRWIGDRMVTPRGYPTA